MKRRGKLLKIFKVFKGFLDVFRFHTTFRLHQRATKLKWYKRWHDFKFAHYFNIFVLFIYVVGLIGGSSGLFKQPTTAFAAANTWTQTSFAGTGDGAYTNTIPYNSNSDVGLDGVSTLSNANSGKWQYRRPITVTNPVGNGALTDYQAQINPFSDANFIDNSNLVGSWHFNEGSGTVASDSSGNTRTAALSGSSYWTASGKFGSAYISSGSNYATVTDNASLYPTNITVESWVYINTLDTYMDVVSKDFSTGRQYKLSIENNKVGFYIFTNGTTYSSNFNNTALTTGNWYHIVGVYNGSNITVYVNGSGSTPTAFATGLNQSSGGALNIGRWSYDNTRNFKGIIDELKIYGRAISSTEVSNRYNSANPKVRSDYQDLRFTKIDGTELPFWQESDGTYWVKYSGTLNTGDTTIYMYYGNSSATFGGSYANSGTNTFVFFDDFNRANGTPGATWSRIGSNAQTTGIENGTLRITTEDNYMDGWGTTNPVSATNGIVMRSRSAKTSPNTSGSWGIYQVDAFSNTAPNTNANPNILNPYGISRYASGAGTQPKLYMYPSGVTVDTPTHTAYRTLETKMHPTNGSVFKADGTQVDSVATGLTGNVYLEFFGNGTNYGNVDWVFARSYAVIELNSSLVGAETGAFVTSGTFTSSVVPSTVSHQGKIYGWVNFTFANSLNSQTLTYDILDSSTGNPINGYTGITISPTDLSGISSIAYPALKVRANFSGSGAASPMLNSWDLAYNYDITAPTVPTALTVGTITSSSVPLSWAASTDSDSGLDTTNTYYIDRAPDSAGSPGTWEAAGTSNTNSFTDSGRTVNTKYWYRVRAKDKTGNYSSYTGDIGGSGGTVTYTDASGLNPRSSTPYVGGYVIHTFTNGGTFTTANTGTVDVLVVAGGGGGGAGQGGGGGGGAGGVVYKTGHSISANSYTITIGTGGSRGTSAVHNATNGGNSAFDTMIANGGGGGKGDAGIGAAGGSCGGANGSTTNTCTPTQGNSGGGTGYGSVGGGSNYTSGAYGGGGGGGAGGAGSAGTTLTGGNGGVGILNAISGIATYYAGGGGGGSNSGSYPAGTGGNGGGGNGGANAIGADGTASTGGGAGAGGSAYNNGGNGGSGIVIIRYSYMANLSAITLTNSPTSPSATAASLSQINLSWSAPSGGGNHYHVYSSSDNYSTPIYDSTGTSASQSGLSSNTQYTYRVYSVNADGVQSTDYAEVSKYTLTNSPTSPNAIAASSSQINLTWSAPSGGVDHYHVYSSSDNYATPIYDNSGTSTSQSSLSANAQYTYRIYGVNVDGAQSAGYAGEPTTITIQPDGTNVKDTQPYSLNPDNNYGNSTAIYVGEMNNAVGITRGLIQFDLAANIPVGSIITDATLSLYLTGDYSNNPSTFRVYRVKRAWSETASSWNRYNTGQNWQSPGAFGSDDTEQTGIGSRDFSNNESRPAMKDFVLYASAVQEMFTGTFQNNGFLIKSDLENDDAYQFSSSDSPESTYRPKLVVTYGVPLSATTLTAVPILSDPITPQNTFKPTINGTGATPNTEVRLYDNGTHKASVTADSSGNYTFSASTPGYSDFTQEGEHNNVTVRGYSASGETTGSIAKTVFIDMTAPTAPTDRTAAKVANMSGVDIDDAAWNGHNNGDTVYFAWNGANDPGIGDSPVTGSDIKRYWVYFGPLAGAVPRTDGQATADSTASAIKTLSSPVSGSDYYLRIQTEDNAGNISSDGSIPTLFVYKFDNTPPTALTYVNATPSGWSTIDSFTFNWQVATDSNSGVGGYAYARRTVEGENSWEDLDLTNRFVQTASVGGVSSKYAGVNTIKIITVDRAGNESAGVTANYLYSPPVAGPSNVHVTYEVDQTVNRMKFSWDAVSGAQGYYYSINQEPSIENSTYSSVTDTGNFKSFNGVNNEVNNIFYVATKDINGNIGWSNPSQTSFTVNSIKPNTPTGITITDASSRNLSIWALTIAWEPLTNPTPNFDTPRYKIERSTDNLIFEEVANVTTNIYSEAGLDNTTTYYYRVRAVDNVGFTSDSSSVASKIPTGKFTIPPEITSEPKVDVKATSADISWTTARISNTIVLYGVAETYSQEVSKSTENVTDHKVTIQGLTPGTTYHFKVRSLDEVRDYNVETAGSTDRTFTTLVAPGISKVEVREVRTNSAIVTWQTTSSATSKIRYGKSINYENSYVDQSSSQTTVHTVLLDQMTDDTIYHLKIEGVDVDGNALLSDDYVFETLAFPKISDVKFEQQKDQATSTLKVVWNTNVPTSSVANYSSVVGSLENSKAQLETRHTLVVSGLKDNTSYTFSVSGRDAYGNEATSDPFNIKTDYDTRPPAISEISTETSIVGYGADAKAQVIVSWFTDEPSTSQVEYNEGVTGNSYSMQTQEDTSLTTSHVVVISDLKPSSSYYFRVKSKDISKNEAKTLANSVLTEQARSSILDVIVKSFENTLGWLFGRFGN